MKGEFELLCAQRPEVQGLEITFSDIIAFETQLWNVFLSTNIRKWFKIYLI